MSIEAEANLLSVEETAKKLGCVKETVRRYIAERRLPAVKLPGGHYRIRLEDVERLIRPNKEGN